jgi:hypothetical protein
MVRWYERLVGKGMSMMVIYMVPKSGACRVRADMSGIIGVVDVHVTS